MRQRKQDRNRKKKLGQFLTPPSLANKIVSHLNLEENYCILEPSCGDGAFLAAIFNRLNRLRVSNTKIVGIELDYALAVKSCVVAKKSNAANIKIIRNDFFQEYLTTLAKCSDSMIKSNSFDLILGNPPFGGSFNPVIEDELDRRLGKRFGKKIKKETYAFFTVACVDLLKLGGKIVFICSDTILTIPTMAGLRHTLMEQGDVSIHNLAKFSDETDYPMIILEFTKTGEPGIVTYDSDMINKETIESTKNLSWGIKPNLTKAFTGPTLSKFFVASAGMTTGKNTLFIRKVISKSTIVETHKFEFYDAPITLQYELTRARLNKLSLKRTAELKEAETNKLTERRVSITTRDAPVTVSLPNSDYLPYNKSNSNIIFSNPSHYIYWKNNGEAVLTYKKTGNWYLRGVGGQPYFGMEGITWSLVASRFNVKYLPPGYILDSGAPCAFLRNNVDRAEMYFVIGWLLSDLANAILKTVINHTRNIQSKDFERMPYPFWLPLRSKHMVIDLVKAMISQGIAGKNWTRQDPEISRINDIFTSNYNEFNKS